MSQSILQPYRTADHIEVMQQLLEEILHIQKENTDIDLDKGLQRVQEIIVESSRVVENSTSTSEMIVDAKILHTGTSVVNTNVSSLNTNLTSYSEAIYVRGLQSYIEGTDQIVMVGKEWECLAPATYHLFKKSHPVTFMRGPFSLDPLPSKDRRVEKQKKVLEPQVTHLTQITEREETCEEDSDVYEHILRWLVKHYKRNDKNPLSYFYFIIDPYDYWRTIENIFHFSFLVRDGSVKMMMHEGLPYIEPVLKRSEDKTQQTTYNYQFCLSLSMAEWRKCIQKFGITFPSIPPYFGPD